jgi:diguanylate cyclase (GGDEF)-like protein
MSADTEQRRLDAIERLQAIDRLADPVLESLARLAAHVTGAGSAAVHIIDETHQHRIAGHEAELGLHPREDSMCRLVVEAGEAIVVEDATDDDRFTYSSFVAGDTPVRFYASVPVAASDGSVVGTVCAFDGTGASLTGHQRILLDEIAIQVATHLELVGLVHELGEAATEDALTGVANRLILADRLAHNLARLRRRGGLLAVAAIDLDRFKEINDTIGHAAGDSVLAATARSLTAALRVEDTLARTGGDEFVVLAEVAGEAEAEQLRKRLEGVIATPVEIGDTTITPEGSVGIVMAERGEGPAELLKRADEALYARKRARGRGR